jgi:hypothetical protein
VRQEVCFCVLVLVSLGVLGHEASKGNGLWSFGALKQKIVQSLGKWE